METFAKHHGVTYQRNKGGAMLVRIPPTVPRTEHRKVLEDLSWKLWVQSMNARYRSATLSIRTAAVQSDGSVLYQGKFATSMRKPFEAKVRISGEATKTAGIK